MNRTPPELQTPLDHFDYPLPKDLIAQDPTRNREDARLMVIDRRQMKIDHAHFRDLPDWVEPGDCLVLNESKVVMAKLVGYRTQTSGRWQGLFLEDDPQTGLWRVMCKTRGNIKPGETVTLQDRNGTGRCRLVMISKLGGGCWAVKPEIDGTADEILSQLGRVPLPHYIRNGNMVDADIEDYQTVFARTAGSVAAPTAGLHFTSSLLDKIGNKGVSICKTTLHVGIGTFRPIACPTVEQHEMHGEYGELDSAATQLINQTRARGGRIVAVGTTSVRLLESAANQHGNDFELQPWRGVTNLFIHPPYKFLATDAMITNFHLPRTSLLVMVRAFGGDSLIKQAYQTAIDNRYRFFSYGDGMLIL